MNLGEHLKSELKDRRQRNPNFSLRGFAKWLGISPAQLSQLMSGKRRASPKVFAKVSERLGLSPLERIDMLRASLPGFIEAPSDAHLLAEDGFRLISDWYHFAILTLTRLPGAKPDPRWVGKKLGISAGEAQEAMARLKRMGLLETAPLFRQRAKPIRVDSELRSDAIRAYHKQNLTLAIEKIDAVDTPLRELHAITMAADPAKLKRARRMIDAFLTEMNELMESGPANEVYTLAIQLFPITTGDAK